MKFVMYVCVLGNSALSHLKTSEVIVTIHQLKANEPQKLGKEQRTNRKTHHDVTVMMSLYKPVTQACRVTPIWTPEAPQGNRSTEKVQQKAAG